MAMQLHFLRAFSSGVGVRVGFVWISRARITMSRSERAVDFPFMGTPPVILIDLVVAGVAFGLGSDMSLPEADGGSLVGAWNFDGPGDMPLSSELLASEDAFLECDEL